MFLGYYAHLRDNFLSYTLFKPSHSPIPSKLLCSYVIMSYVWTLPMRTILCKQMGIFDPVFKHMQTQSLTTPTSTIVVLGYFVFKLYSKQCLKGT